MAEGKEGAVQTREDWRVAGGGEKELGCLASKLGLGGRGSLNFAGE